MPTSRSIESAHAFAVRLMQHLVVPTFVLNAERKVIIWNRACERLTGIPAHEVIGTSGHWRAFYDEERYCLADLVVLDKLDQMKALYACADDGAGDQSLGLRAENWCVMPKMNKRLYLAIDAGPIFDEEGNLLAVVETLRDQTEQKLAQMALQSLAVKDGLTGLANRRSFDEKLEAEWLHNQREGTSLAVLLVDVDHFKLYNDNYGHQQGDACLKAVAGAIDAQVFRPSDLAARYGGEEFVVVMPNTDLEGALHVADRIRDAVLALNLPHLASLTARQVTLSIGAAAMVPSDERQAAELVEAADGALYRAKHQGRNRVVGADRVQEMAEA